MSTIYIPLILSGFMTLFCGFFTGWFDAGLAEYFLGGQSFIVNLMGMIFALALARVLFGFAFHAVRDNDTLSLPMSREQVFVSTALTGVLEILGAYVLTGLIILLVFRLTGWNSALLADVGLFVLTGLTGCLLTYAVGVLAAVLSGTSAVQLLTSVYYLWAPVITVAAVMMLVCEGVYGMVLDNNLDFLKYFPGMHQFGMYISSAHASLWMALYLLAGLLILALAGFLFKRSKPESIGQSVEYKWLADTLVVLISVTGGIVFAIFCSLGTIFTGDGLMSDGAFWGRFLMAGIPLLWLTNGIAQMRVNIFNKRALKNALLYLAVTALLFTGMKMDFFGIETYVPATKNIKSVTVSLGSLSASMDNSDIVLTSGDAVDAVRAMHESIVANKDINLGANDAYTSSTIDVTYTLTSGMKVARSYTVYKSLIGTDMETTIQNVLSNKDYVSQSGFPDSTESVTLNTYDEETDIPVDSQDYKTISAALQKDIENLSVKKMMNGEYDEEGAVAGLEVMYDVKRLGGDVSSYSSVYRNFSLTKAYTNTIQALETLGYIDG